MENKHRGGMGLAGSGTVSALQMQQVSPQAIAEHELAVTRHNALDRAMQFHSAATASAQEVVDSAKTFENYLLGKDQAPAE